MSLLITLHHEGASINDWGFILGMLNDQDPRSAKEQLDAGYQHAGGWDPFRGHTMRTDGALTYPGDPPLYPKSTIFFREERIVLYDCSWVAVVQRDGTYEICRMD